MAKRKKTRVVAAGTLPDDALAVVLACLPARSLAASRRVCSVWRDLVDERRLLDRHLLPHSVRGLFVNYDDHRRPHFFARPMRKVDGEFGFIEEDDAYYRHKRGAVLDHCNGLVLYTTNSTAPAMYVCNPATRRWARLPACSSRRWMAHRRAFLAFDPGTSPQCYLVLLAPHTPSDFSKHRSMEWPPSEWTWPVFSSRDGEWGKRTFVREGEAAGTVAGLRNSTIYVRQAWLSATYWKGTLYLNFFREYVVRMCLSSNKYKVIKSPVYQDDSYIGATTYLGKSEKGMCFATVHHGHCQLRVWMLHESCEDSEWVLIHQSDLKPFVWWAKELAAVAESGKNLDEQYPEAPWLLDDCNAINETKKRNALPWQEHESEWDSDDDDAIDIASMSSNKDSWQRIPRREHYNILGFHPYKEVVLLHASYVAVAYHLKNSKVHHLGSLCPSDTIDKSFVYTPCRIGDL